MTHVARSRLEPGCISHAVHIDCENPLRLVFFEEWVDQATLRVHFKAAGSLDFMKTVRELAASGSSMTTYEATIARRS